MDNLDNLPAKKLTIKEKAALFEAQAKEEADKNKGPVKRTSRPLSTRLNNPFEQNI